LRACLGPLRSQFLFPTIRLAIASATRLSPSHFRVVHFSVQSNHLHLIAEAADARSLSAGVRSIVIRVARLVNRLLFRTGRFWADRWHGRALTSPREVRHALLYVLANFRKHTHVQPRIGIDPYSSGAHFHGWREWSPLSATAPPFAERPPPIVDAAVTPVSAPRSWLAAVGYRRVGLLGLRECPAT
jgi:REP element-mobilizing transposase RayT